VGHFASTIDSADGVKEMRYGAVVIATGAAEYYPTEYLFGQDERIVTQLQFDRLLEDDAARVKDARQVVFIQCVGSREPLRPYCSRVCCSHSMVSAIALKELDPDMEVFILYREIRTYGQWEDLYRKARDLGVIFIRYTREKKPKVFQRADELKVSVHDPIIRRDVLLSADYIVLATAIVPNDHRHLVEMFKCSVNADGFMNEAHPKLRPVDMSVDGLFVAGLCHYPKPLDEAIVQAKAAVSRAGAILSQRQLQLDAVKSYTTDQCDGCALCLDVCPYQALSLESFQDKGRTHQRIKVDAAVCKGCGLCQATCPKEGILVHGFTLSQLMAETNAAFETVQ